MKEASPHFTRTFRFPAMVVLFSATSLLSAFSQTVSRGPYLQLGTATSIVVRWRTSTARDAQVIYGTSLLLLDHTNTLPAFSTEHEVQLTGLTPNTRYFYWIGTTTNTLS